METEYIDKLFLEISQFTKARTKREIELERELKRLQEILRGSDDVLELRMTFNNLHIMQLIPQILIDMASDPNEVIQHHALIMFKKLKEAQQ